MFDIEKINRGIFENTILTMKKYGPRDFIDFYSKGVFQKRESIKKALLAYYESTEEFEKCQFVIDFFKDLEISISSTEKQKEETHLKI